MLALSKSEEIALLRNLYSDDINDEDKRVLERLKMVIGRRHLGLLNEDNKKICMSFWESKGQPLDKRSNDNAENSPKTATN